MLNKKTFCIVLLLIGIIAVSAVSAAENNSDTNIHNTDNVKGIAVSDDSALSQDNSISEDKYISEDSSNEISEDSSNVIQEDSSSNEEMSENTISNEDIESPVKEKNKLTDSAYNCYVNSVSTYYISGRYVYLGWSGYFDGYFRVYKGSSCVHNEYVYGYNRDLQWSTDNLGAGTYTAKLISYDGYTKASGTIKIAKATTKMSCKSFTATQGTTFYCYAYVWDKNDGANIDGGYVSFKINGKTYKAKLNDGVAILKFKVPSKVKKYTCKATFAGNKDIKGSSVTFKMTVKKKKVIKYHTMTLSTKWKKYVTKKWKKYKAQTYKFKSYSMSTLCMFLYKNGKMVNPYNYLTRYQYKYKGKWYWTKWRSSSGEAAYHKSAGLKKNININKVQFKFRIN